MNNNPQAVTERYISNLIRDGRNQEFEIFTITRRNNIVEDEHIGTYYEVEIGGGTNLKVHKSVGATIQQATHRCLEKHGVTFR